MVFIDPIQAKHERLTLSQGNIKTNPNPFLIRGKARRHKHVRQCCRNRVANLSVDRAVVVIDRMTASHSSTPRKESTILLRKAACLQFPAAGNLAAYFFGLQPGFLQNLPIIERFCPGRREWNRELRE